MNLSQLLFGLLFTFSASIASAQEESKIDANRVVSSIDSSRTNEIVLIQEFTVHVPLDSVWNAFTTQRGWEGAFVAVAEVDLKIGGSIKSSYDTNARIGDSTTIVNNIINYVPRKFITLQAELTENFPAFMKSEAKHFYNVIYFEEVEAGKTKVTSYGIGYKNNPKYLSLLKFFIEGNAYSYLNLINYLENAVKVKF